jgi:hypothetical protein
MCANLLVALLRTDGVMPNYGARASATVSVSDEAKKKKKKNLKSTRSMWIAGCWIQCTFCHFIHLQMYSDAIHSIFVFWFNAHHGQSKLRDAGARGVVADACIAFTGIDNT